MDSPLTGVAPELTNGNVWLTSPRDDDAAAVREGWRDSALREAWISQGASDLNAAAKTVEAGIASWTGTASLDRQFAVRTSRDGPLVGWLAIKTSHGSPEILAIDIWVLPDHRRRGIARDAVALGIDYAFAQMGARLIEIEVRSGNDKALELARSLGFREIPGALRGFHEHPGVYMIPLTLAYTTWTLRRRQ